MSRPRPIVQVPGLPSPRGAGRWGVALAVLLAAGCAGPGRQAAASTLAAASPDRARPPEKGPPPALRVPDQRRFKLSNGLAVRLVEYRRLPIVALNLVVDAGAARDPEQAPGTASLTATMLTEGGTRRRTAIQISDEAGFLGASLGAGAAVDSASLSGSTLAKHLARFLDLFADVATNPAFPAPDFERVQDERLVTLLQQRDQPQAIASKVFQPVFWGTHPYGHYALGTEESVKALSPAALAAFHRRLWTPANAELVVVGDVGEAELRPLLERTLGTWAAGTPAPPLPPALPAAPHRTVVLEKADAPQSYLLAAMPGLRRTSEAYVASTVAFQVLGGGMASRLFRNLREEKGYTYGVYARGEARKLAGVSYVVGSVKADVTGPALKEILAELRRLREEPVPAEELEESKASLVLGLPADFATAGATAGHLADLVVNGLPDDYWNRYAERVTRVSAEDVKRFADEYLDPSRLTVVMVAHPDGVQAQLAGLPLGPVEVRAAPAAPAAPGASAAPAAAPAPAPAAPATKRPARPAAKRAPAAQR